MRVVVAVIAVVAVAAVAWLVVEVRALRSPPPPTTTTTTAPSSAAPIAAAPPPTAPPPATPPARAAVPHPRPRPAHTLSPSGAPVLPPPEPAQPPPPSGEPSAAELADARARVQAVLAAVALVCPLGRDGDRAQHLVVRVTTSRDRVQSLEHRDGALPPATAACVDKRLYAARWPAVAAGVTLDVDVRAADLP